MTTPFLRYFVTHEMGLAKVFSCTEFEVSGFTRSKFTEGGLEFKNSTLDPDHAPFQGILSLMTSEKVWREKKENTLRKI